MERVVIGETRTFEGGALSEAEAEGRTPLVLMLVGALSRAGVRPEYREAPLLRPDELVFSGELALERENGLSRAGKAMAVPIMVEMKSSEVLFFMVASLPAARAFLIDSLCSLKPYPVFVKPCTQNTASADNHLNGSGPLLLPHDATI